MLCNIYFVKNVHYILSKKKKKIYIHYNDVEWGEGTEGNLAHKNENFNGKNVHENIC